MARVARPLKRAPSSACPACGQPIIPPGLRLSPLKALILNLVRKRPGIAAEDLRCLVWPDADGGPDTRSNIHVHIHQLNRTLAPQGLALRGSRFHGYRLVFKADARPAS